MFKWHGRFKDGRQSIEDDERCGRSPSVRSTMVRKVKDMIYQDRRFTVRSLSSELGISKDTVHRILKEDIHISKVSARWVPRLLSDDQMAKRVSCSEEFLERYEANGDAFLDRIVTQDAPAHTASTTQLEIDVLGFQRLSHPPYIPDLAPMDFRVFPEVKSHLRGVYTLTVPMSW